MGVVGVSKGAILGRGADFGVDAVPGVAVDLRGDGMGGTSRGLLGGGGRVSFGKR